MNVKLMNFDPARELETLTQRLNQAFGFPAARPSHDDALFADWAPAIDVEETDQEYLVKADLPDVKRDDVKVGIQDGILSLEGERKQEKDEKKKKFHRVERLYGKFVRRMSVPTDVDESKVGAEFRNGVLVVRMPKSAAARPKAIDVKVA